MASFSNPISSAVSDVEFSRLSAAEIKRISVKRIRVTPTFDTFGGPVPGGLYDPALGAVLDKNCSTCRLSAVHCPGHPGHIELPVTCYHPSFIEQTIRLLRGKCYYCHRFRMTRAQVELFTCKLQLLQYGLLDELRRLEMMHIQTKNTTSAPVNGEGTEEVAAGLQADSGEDEDVENYIGRRNKFVRKSINKAKKRDREDPLTLIRNPAATAERKLVVKEFMAEITKSPKCTVCNGWSPRYRKDGSTKIFMLPLPQAQRNANKALKRAKLDPYASLKGQRKQEEAKRAMTNGDGKHDTEMLTDGLSETAGPEDFDDDITMEGAAEDESSQDDEAQHYVTAGEVRAALALLFGREQTILNLIYTSRPNRKVPSVGPDMFFMSHVLVPPNKYRPASIQGSDVLEAMQNGSLNRIIKAGEYLLQIKKEIKTSPPEGALRKQRLGELLAAQVTLQEAVNSLIDQAPNPSSRRQNENGIKQTLEKKEGLFRMNMMGKRVNFAARSVISPDPNIETNEIGVPLVFAKKLTYPEPVTNHNFFEMKAAVINGVEKYPGAAAIENENGQVLSLKFKSVEERIALANQLLTPTPGLKGAKNKKVYRHLQSGDVVIMNRQPTLHKPSMMGHRARVLRNEKTIRMHYANCNTYNADFDGDEMNMHFPQNEIARSEALQIADTDHQYLSATAGKPLRGLIQDHISMGVQFTSRDSFFSREDYQQLLYGCLRPESFHTVSERIEMLPPAIFKPKPMWTGKQVISTILKNITPANRAGLNLRGKSSTSADSWGEGSEEQIVIFKDGEHLCGILDKAQMGPSAGGLIHSIHELYGHATAGKLLSILGRLLTRFLNMRAWTCGMDDLYLTEEGDKTRRKTLTQTESIGRETAAKYVTLEAKDLSGHDPELLARLEDVSRDEEKQTGLDKVYNTRTAVLSSEITAACLPAGLRKPFPRNQMQAMTISGAKGSSVNANLISCNLGQQVLEGRRVPVMVSGKTLPSFRAYETNVSAGGYVSGRFLTGINPKEYYFHAMAGREGLIDTAVKTSKSGYLQRCIVKGLEGLRTEYDTSVRESSNGAVVQFLYGEDGLDITKQKHLTEFTFLAQNHLSVMASINLAQDHDRIYNEDLSELKKLVTKAVRRTGRIDAMDPVMASYPPGGNYGSTSESFQQAMEAYIKSNPDKSIKEKARNILDGISKKTFRSMMDFKYMKSVVDPGEAVGVVAAQSVGEPSTQMTLNTFHLAGHSAKNVTLGIPRLREIVMTASARISTPMMTLKVIPELSLDQGTTFAKSISKLSLAEIIDQVSVKELIGNSNGHGQAKVYDIAIKFYPASEYMEQYAIKIEDVGSALERVLVPGLEKLITAEFKKKAREASLTEATASVPDIGISVGRIEEARPETSANEDREGGEDDIDEDADPEDAKQTATRGRKDDMYDEPDADEEALVASDDEMSGTDEVDGSATPKETKEKTNEENPETFEREATAPSDEESREREENLKSNYEHLSRFRFSRKKGDFCNITLTYDINTPKLLLLPLLEKCARDSLIQSVIGLSACTISEEKVKDPLPGEPATENVITTEGVNLLAMRDYQDIIHPHSIYTNSIHDMLTLYGVEAARATIVKEIDGVFKGHSISVDNRHLNLIADAMTQSGSYMAFSRNGIIKESGSVLAKMSFETVMGFLKEAVLDHDIDGLVGPSAKIVVGKRSTVGTGSFDVVVGVGGEVFQQ